MNYVPAKKSKERSDITPAQNNADFISLIKAFESQIKLALPKHLTPSRMTRIIISEVRKEPKLASCDRASFFGAIITCAQLGLEPGAAMGLAYLLPFWNGKTKQLEVQLIIGYQGKIDLAERDGRVTINCSVVYEKDTFDYGEGDEPFIKHRPYIGAEDPGAVIASYAVAKYKDGRKKIRVMRMHEIQSALEQSPSASKGFGPWKTHFAEMAMKTAIHRLFKQLPKNPEMAIAVELTDKEEIGESQNFDDVYGQFREKNHVPELENIDVDMPLTVDAESTQDVKSE